MFLRERKKGRPRPTLFYRPARLERRKTGYSEANIEEVATSHAAATATAEALLKALAVGVAASAAKAEHLLELAHFIAQTLNLAFLATVDAALSEVVIATSPAIAAAVREVSVVLTLLLAAIRAVAEDSSQNRPDDRTANER